MSGYNPDPRVRIQAHPSCEVSAGPPAELAKLTELHPAGVLSPEELEAHKTRPRDSDAPGRGGSVVLVSSENALGVCSSRDHGRTTGRAAAWLTKMVGAEPATTGRRRPRRSRVRMASELPTRPCSTRHIPHPRGTPRDPSRAPNSTMADPSLRRAGHSRSLRLAVTSPLCDAPPTGDPLPTFSYVPFPSPHCCCWS